MTRLLTPSEIELWELAKKATALTPLRTDLELVQRRGKYKHVIYPGPTLEWISFAGASPDKITALLETLEKTRSVLSDAREHMAVLNIYGLHGAEDAERTEALIERIDALLSGFSGDASKEEEYGTPPEVFGPLDDEFHFTLDAAASAYNAKCSRYFDEMDDGLTQDWGTETVWLNPPYGPALGAWIRKCRAAADAGATVVALVPVNTDTSWWHDEITGHAEVRFIRGRVKFLGAAHRAPMPLAVVIWRPSETNGGKR